MPAFLLSPTLWGTIGLGSAFYFLPLFGGDSETENPDQNIGDARLLRLFIVLGLVSSAITIYNFVRK
jgi:hypothetical protein